MIKSFQSIMTLFLFKSNFKSAVRFAINHLSKCRQRAPESDLRSINIAD